MELSRLPSIDQLVRSTDGEGLPHPMLVDIARRVVDEARARAKTGAPAGGVEERYREEVRSAARRLLRPVINATGVLLHTNLGRAPVEFRAPGGYANLEYDLGAGQRGSRHHHAAGLAALACGAEDAIVVNNNAAAVLLGLAALCAGRDVLVSRGEAVEIGGGFRIPEILAASGARLVDVGTTNRTRVADYRASLTSRTAAVLSVHPSNFSIEGFVEKPARRELASLAHERGVLFLCDIGSGLIDEDTPWLARPPAWLAGEPGARQSLSDGADVVFFSGDKLLGGPQAGIAVGRSEVIDAMRRHALARALRVDKHRLWLLQDTLASYLDGTAAERIPFWRMATSDPDDRAVALSRSVPGATTATGESLVGAGSAPGSGIRTTLVRLEVVRPDAVAARLREADPPVVVRVEDGAVVIDLRTVEPADDHALLTCLKSAL